MNRSKARALLTGFTFRPGRAYGGLWSDKAFDKKTARQDWEKTKVFLRPEFQQLNPGRVCWGEHEFDGVELPGGQDSFSGLNIARILDMFPM